MSANSLRLNINDNMPVVLRLSFSYLPVALFFCYFLSLLDCVSRANAVALASVVRPSVRRPSVVRP